MIQIYRYICICFEICFEKSACGHGGLANLNPDGDGQRTIDSGRNCSLSPIVIHLVNQEELMLRMKRVFWWNSILLSGGQPSVLFRTSTDWVRPTHKIEHNLLYSKSTNINLNLIENYLRKHSSI